MPTTLKSLVAKPSRHIPSRNRRSRMVNEKAVLAMLAEAPTLADLRQVIEYLVNRGGLTALLAEAYIKTFPILQNLL